jgi:hypothetical protein
VGNDAGVVPGPEEGVPRWARPTLYGFLAVVLACGLLSIEAWPLTGWRLYHERRGEVRSSWQIVAVDPEGGESTIHLGSLPLGWHNTSKLIGEFDDMASAERDAVCAAWALPARRQGGDAAVAQVRVYRVRGTLGADPPDRTRQLRWTCAAADP